MNADKTETEQYRTDREQMWNGYGTDTEWIQKQSHVPPGLGVGLEADSLILEKVLVTETARKTTNNLHADLPRSSNCVTASGES